MEEDLLLPAEVKEWAEGKNEPLQRKQAEVSETHVTNATHPAEPPILNPKCLVQFRRHENYNGEYGFDWLRTKEDIRYNKEYKILYTGSDYRDIVGRIDMEEKKDEAGKVILKDGKPVKEPVFYVDEDKYKSLVNKEYNSKHNFKIPWKKDENGSPYTYYVPHLSLLPGREALLTLVVNIDEPVNSLKLYCENEDYFTFKEKIIDTSGKGKGEHIFDLKIYCSKENLYGKEQLITICANEDPKLVCGKIVVVPNKKRYKLKIGFVKVFFEDSDKEKLKNEIDDLEIIKKIQEEFKSNTKGFNQALVEEYEFIPEFVPLDLREEYKKDPTKFDTKTINKNGKVRDSDKILSYISKKHAENYMEGNPDFVYFYVYNADWNRAQCPGRISVMTSFDIDTHIHEGAHALGVEHSFSKDSKHIFDEYRTENYMDYTPYHRPKSDWLPQNHFWKWQWEIIQKSAKIAKK